MTLRVNGEGERFLVAWNPVLNVRWGARTIHILNHQSVSAGPAHGTQNKFPSAGVANPLPKSSPRVARERRRQRTDDGTAQERQGDFPHGTGRKPALVDSNEANG